MYDLLPGKTKVLYNNLLGLLDEFVNFQSGPQHLAMHHHPGLLFPLQAGPVETLHPIGLGPGVQVPGIAIHTAIINNQLCGDYKGDYTSVKCEPLVKYRVHSLRNIKQSFHFSLKVDMTANIITLINTKLCLGQNMVY